MEFMPQFHDIVLENNRKLKGGAKKETIKQFISKTDQYNTLVDVFWPDITRGTEEPTPRHKYLGANSPDLVQLGIGPDVRNKFTLILLNKNPKIYVSIIRMGDWSQLYDFSKRHDASIS